MDLHAHGDIVVEKPLRADLHPDPALVVSQDRQDEEVRLLAVHVLVTEVLHGALDIGHILGVEKMERARLRRERRSQGQEQG